VLVLLAAFQAMQVTVVTLETEALAVTLELVDTAVTLATAAKVELSSLVRLTHGVA